MTEPIPECIPRTHSRFGRALGALLLSLLGWKVVGQFPQTGRFVAAVAPHTSNWDFIIAIAVKLRYGIRIRFLGKHTIFIGPVGWLLRHWGGIAVDRRSAHGIVHQVAELFTQESQLILGIAPEGTRKYTPEWKTGFLQIAKAAQVPVVPMALDFSTKCFRIMPAIAVGDDIQVSLATIKQCFPKSMAKYPNQVSG